MKIILLILCLLNIVNGNNYELNVSKKKDHNLKTNKL